MKKILLFLMLLVGFTLLTSCGDDDEPQQTDLGELEITFIARHLGDGIDLDGTVYVYENVPLGKVGGITFPNDKVGSFSIDGLTYYVIHEINIKNGTGKIVLPKTPRIKNYYFLFYSPSLVSLRNGFWEATPNSDYHENKLIDFSR